MFLAPCSLLSSWKGRLHPVSNFSQWVIYYINSCIPCVCVCLSVCVFVISEILESSMLLSPTWRASLGELHWLLLELTQCVVWDKKPLELFRAILKKLAVFLKKDELFAFKWDAERKKNVFSLWESFAKAEWKLWCLGNELWGSGNRLWLANRLPSCKSHCRLVQNILQAYQGEIGAFSPLSGTQQGRRTYWLGEKFC